MMTGSILDGLRARREQLVAAQAKTVPFPRWEDPSLTLRIHPVDGAQLTRILKSAKESDPDAMTAIHASIVAAATEHVTVGGDTSMKVRELAEYVGLGPEASAGDVIRRVAIADGDIKGLADAVLKLSGYLDGVDYLDEALAGE